nr:MAG TPA: hypothetical protein [Caudoviricetes sp.]
MWEQGCYSLRSPTANRQQKTSFNTVVFDEVFSF